MLHLRLVVCCVIAAGCGKAGDKAGAGKTGDISIKIGYESGATMKTGFVDGSGDKVTNRRGKKVRSNLVVLSSFDLTDLKDFGTPLTSDDQTKLALLLLVEEDDKGQTDLRPGTYEYNQSMTGLTLSSFRVFRWNGVEDQWARMGGVQGATVKLTTVTDDALAGELSLVDGADHATGKFTVKLKKK
jgi:hypothetical protein